MSTRICPICEAGCGLSVATDGREVISITANNADVFSLGHICPKGIALKSLDQDPDRLRTPLIRIDGELKEASFSDAYAVIQQKLGAIVKQHGNHAVASYIGNPSAHNIGLSMGLGAFASTLGSMNLYSAGSVDQIPKQLASELMFGDSMAIPVPDIERCEYLLMLGANPAVSNGSLWMVPKFRDKLRDLHQRGGKLVTIDPRRTETARLADEHHFIMPGTDAWLLMGIIVELQTLGLGLPDDATRQGGEQLLRAISQISLAEAANRTGISEPAIQSIAHSLRHANCAAVYGRVGTTLQKFGTLTSFLIEVINLMTGNLSREGGAMFPEQPFVSASHAKHGLNYNRYQSRVSHYPEVFGQMPVAALAEEIETAGAGQIKALVCFAGNPLVSTPDSDRLETAIAGLDLLVCVDIYHNETSKHADVILPGTSPFEEGHYDSFLGSMGYKNAARYSQPLFESVNPQEWDMGITLAYITQNGKVPDAQALAAYEDDLVAAAITGYVNDDTSPLHGRDVQELLGMIEPQSGVERLLDLGIRAGRWGDHFGVTDGLTLQQLIDSPNGIDLGPIRADRLAEVVKHADGRMDLSPAIILTDIDRLMQHEVNGGYTLVGRRNVATNNSWLGNLDMLGKGRKLCVLEMNPLDAETLGVESGDQVKLATATGQLTVPMTVSDEIMRGVVSLPHGFSEDKAIWQSKAEQGGNYNRLIATSEMDLPSATSALNGVSVDVTRI
jgi:anaerobic selenocysteine-containing dehydrogenase